MKIALIGYGKMGKVIEAIAIQRNHEIIARYNSQFQLNEENWIPCDVAIEFTSPEVSINNIEFCINKGVPICVGSTGWYHEFDRLSELCKLHNSAMIAATNFSIGVNLYWKVAEYMSKLFANVPNYRAGIVENHHTEKKDAPSGTAITLAERYLAHQTSLSRWKLTETMYSDQVSGSSALDILKDSDSAILPIVAIRENQVPGTHQLFEIGENDFIKLEHQANNRKGFAEGAVLAAEWLQNKKGVFRMSDMLKFEE